MTDRAIHSAVIIPRPHAEDARLERARRGGRTFSRRQNAARASRCSRLRDAAEQRHDESAERLDAGRVETGAQQRPPVARAQVPGEDVGVLIEPSDRRLLGARLLADLADDLLEDMLQRHQPGRAAVLVHHDGDGIARMGEVAQQRLDRLRLRHEPHRAEQAVDLRLGMEEHVAREEHADHVVGGALVGEHAFLAVDLHEFGKPFGAGGHVEERHIHARRHQLPGAQVREVHHLLDHPARLAAQRALLLGHGDERLEFAARDVRRRAEAPGQRVRALPRHESNQVADRADHAEEQEQRPRDPMRDFHRPADGDPFGTRLGQQDDRQQRDNAADHRGQMRDLREMDGDEDTQAVDAQVDDHVPEQHGREQRLRVAQQRPDRAARPGGRKTEFP
jgi:hypothetical protein